MMVVGIDPGTRHLGWGILRVEGTRISHVAHGVVDTDTEASIADRLCRNRRSARRVDRSTPADLCRGRISVLLARSDGRRQARPCEGRGAARLC